MCVRNTEPKTCTVYLKISLICMHYACNILFTYLSQPYKPNFHAKRIWLKFTINYSLLKFNYNWRHCSANSLTVVMLCVCTRRVCVRNTELVCKVVRLAFSFQTSAISFPFIPIPSLILACKLSNLGLLKFSLVNALRLIYKFNKTSDEK